ncbi:hypothetical protein JNK13_05695, partial [bacterium]|nr:hypothetical protein [bacterium]
MAELTPQFFSLLHPGHLFLLIAWAAALWGLISGVIAYRFKRQDFALSSERAIVSNAMFGLAALIVLAIL